MRQRTGLGNIAFFALGLGFALALGPACASGTGPRDPATGGGGLGGGDPDGPEMSLQGVDTSQLTPRERREWSRSVTRLLAPCPEVPVSIAQCVQEKRACRKCVAAAKFVAKAVRDGLPEAEVERRYRLRFDPSNVKPVAFDESPSKGPESAPVTIVEFADFECPFCGKMFEKLREVYRQNPGQVRIVYKFYPLPMHPHAEIAARAGFAAMKQGKFWEMHDKMFQNQKHLEQSDLEAYAREIGLDPAKFRQDFDSPQADERIARDRKLGDTLGVAATPTLYVNGHEFDLKQDIQDWVAQELSASAPAAAPQEPVAPEAAKK
jgi:protein-disulfide isomerase